MNDTNTTTERDSLLLLRPEPAAEVMLREEEFGAILAGGNMPVLNLNDESLSVWRLCDGTRTVAQIRKVLLDEYDEEELDARLFELVQFFLDNGYLVNAP